MHSLFCRFNMHLRGRGRGQNCSYFRLVYRQPNSEPPQIRRSSFGSHKSKEFVDDLSGCQVSYFECTTWLQIESETNVLSPSAWPGLYILVWVYWPKFLLESARDPAEVMNGLHAAECASKVYISLTVNRFAAFVQGAGSLLWPHSCARQRNLFVCSWIQTTPSVCKVNFIIIFLPMKFSQTFRESFLYGDNESIACYALNLERIVHNSAITVIWPHQWEGVIVKEIVRQPR